MSQDDAGPDAPLVICGTVVEVVSRTELFMWQNLWNQDKEDADITDPVVLARLRNLLRLHSSDGHASD